MVHFCPINHLQFVTTSTVRSEQEASCYPVVMRLNFLLA